MVMKLSPRNSSAYVQRGAAYLAMRDPDRAAADYAKALEMEPGNRKALYNLGLCYRSGGKDDKALEAFNRLLKLDPKHPDAPYQEAAIYSRQGKIDSACIWLETAAGNGFKDWAAVKKAPDLDRLRDVRCYQQLLSGK